MIVSQRILQFKSKLMHSTKNRFLLGISTCIGVVAVGVILVWRRVQLKRMDNVFYNVEELSKPHVHIRNKDEVIRKLNVIVTGGNNKLQVIADFDRTLTKFRHNGKLVDTCYNALDDSPHLPDSYREKAQAVRDKYYAIEIDPNLTPQEKYPFMVEWWTKAHDLLKQHNISRTTIQQIVTESSIILRDGSSWMFEVLHKHEVPLLIFSAGIGDVIEGVINNKYNMYNNMRVVSNYMDFNNQGILVGFKGELIHIYNKNESAIHKSDYFEKLQRRDNIILMGDSMGDLKMADGAKNAQNVLKIGFLNDKVDQLLDKYCDAYDIVLVNDETMDIANAILRQIL